VGTIASAVCAVMGCTVISRSPTLVLHVLNDQFRQIPDGFELRV
jgi:hypothetical protein